MWFHQTGICSRGRILLLSSVVAAVASLPVEPARADAQIQVTARVVNRCVVDLPSRPPWTKPGRGWRKWIKHRCKHPVHPHITVQRVAAQQRALIGRAIARSRAGHHVVVTISY